MIGAPKIVFQTLPPVFMLSITAAVYFKTDLDLTAAVAALCLTLPIVALNWLFGIRAKTLRQHMSMFFLATLVAFAGMIAGIKIFGQEVQTKGCTGQGEITNDITF